MCRCVLSLCVVVRSCVLLLFSGVFVCSCCCLVFVVLRVLFGVVVVGRLLRLLLIVSVWD